MRRDLDKAYESFPFSGKLSYALSRSRRILSSVAQIFSSDKRRMGVVSGILAPVFLVRECEAQVYRKPGFGCLNKVPRAVGKCARYILRGSLVLISIVRISSPACSVKREEEWVLRAARLTSFRGIHV